MRVSVANSPRSSLKNYRVHCLATCTFRSLSSLSIFFWVFSVIEITFHPKFNWISFRVVKLHSGKNKRRRHRNLPYSETICRVSFTCKQLRQYRSPAPHTLYRAYALTCPAAIPKFIKTKERVYIRNDFSSHRISFRLLPIVLVKKALNASSSACFFAKKVLKQC